MRSLEGPSGDYPFHSSDAHPLVHSWNFFRCNINEALIREVADAMVANGLRDAGFQYVNIGERIMGTG